MAADRRPGQIESKPTETNRMATILLVDDDALTAMGSADMIEDLGHTVHLAFSGREALDMIGAGEPFDLVITDQSMPGMTGTELARAIRALNPALPIVVATGYADLPEGEGEGLGRLSKPYSQAELAATIERHARAPS